MTDRYNAFIVTLDHAIREDDAQEHIAALGMVKDVIAVEPVTNDPTAQVAQVRADYEWRKRIANLLADH